MNGFGQDGSVKGIDMQAASKFGRKQLEALGTKEFCSAVSTTVTKRTFTAQPFGHERTV